MPRGYLKHQKAVGRRVARGGSSYRAPWGSEKDHLPDLRQELRVQARLDFLEYIQEEAASQEERKAADDPSNKGQIEGECPICYEHGPLHRLMKNCKHAPACYDCLREIYITQAQRDVANYPLLCFHPSCTAIVREAQIRRWVKTEKEMSKHHRLHVLSKAYSSQHKLVIHCPVCDHPRQFSKGTSETSIHVFRCLQCSETFALNDGTMIGKDIVQALESLKKDGKGRNDGWGRCPACMIVISKGDGCDHMRCCCGKQFSWEHERFVHKKKSAGYKSGQLADEHLT